MTNTKTPKTILLSRLAGTVDSDCYVVFAYEYKQLETELNLANEQREVLLKAMRQFAECDLNESNCASLEIATKRIRNLANDALADCKVKP